MIAFILQILPLVFIGGIALAYVIGIPSYAVFVGIKRLVSIDWASIGGVTLVVMLVGGPALIVVITWLAGQ